MCFLSTRPHSNLTFINNNDLSGDELLVSAALGIASLSSFLVKSPALPSTDAVLAHLFNLSLKRELSPIDPRLASQTVQRREWPVLS